MNTLDAIFTRKSTRKFADKPISEADIRTVLTAGMSGPSAVNARPYAFIIATDKKVLGKMADANGRAAEPCRHAAFAVLVCGDTDKAFKMAPDFWNIDCSIACQNMILAAHELGIGSVWLGTWPMEANQKNQKELFDLPENIKPHSLIAFGYPEEGAEFPKRDLYEEEKVHYNKW